MIRKIVKEEIEKHEEKIGDIIKTQLENTTDRLERISQEVVSITISLEFTQEQLDEELAKLKNDVGKNQTDINDIGHDLLDSQYVMETLIELEDRSCDGNLREEVQDIVENKLGITVEIDFDRCHRTGKFKRNQSKPRTIVCRLLRFKGKEKKLQNSKKLKDTGIFIYEDFCKATMEI